VPLKVILRRLGAEAALPATTSAFTVKYIIRFMWNASRGHRLAPWRSPYLKWRIETYCGLKMNKIGFLEFWGFMWRERVNLAHFLKWTAEMDRYARPKPKNP